MSCDLAGSGVASSPTKGTPVRYPPLLCVVGSIGGACSGPDRVSHIRQVRVVDGVSYIRQVSVVGGGSDMSG